MLTWVVEMKMNVQRTIKHIRRDVKKSPGKMLVLGVLAVVGVYFWMPLIGTWYGGNETGFVPRTDSQERLPMADSSLTIEDSKSNLLEPTWDQLVGWLEQDSLTKSAKLEDKLLDPFRPIDMRSAPMDGSGVGELASTEIKPDREVTPDSLGLILKATIIGGPRGVASINGRTYLENEIVKVSDLFPNRPSGEFSSRDKNNSAKIVQETIRPPSFHELRNVEYTIKEIHHGVVVLARKGRIFELKVRREHEVMPGVIRIDKSRAPAI